MRIGKMDLVFHVRILTDEDGMFVDNLEYLVTLNSMKENEDPFEFEYALLDEEQRLNNMLQYESFLFNHERGNPKSLAQVTKVL